jgi:formylglycine-generating enzyme required for sulfatase activity
VHIEVRPEADRISVRGGLFRIDLGDRFLLRPGDYTVVAEKEGYRILQHPIEVRDVDNETFRLTLERLPGLLVVTTGEVTGAEVFVDGEKVGETPLAGVEVAEGRHAIRVVAKKHLPYTHDLQVEGGGVESLLEVELEPAWANVSLDSEPGGAVLFVDGEEVGPAPLTIALGAGSRRLELRLPGRKTWRKTLFVEANRPVSLGVVALGPADGRLRLSSIPAGAGVTVDGRFRGYTPLEVSVASGKGHRVRLSKLGFKSAIRKVRLDPDQEQALSVKLVAQQGEIRIATRPDGASLYIDGIPRGDANQDVVLPAVAHVLEVRKDGYETYRTRVTPRPGFPQALRVRLLSLDEAQTADLKSRIVTPAGQEMVLVTGGRFSTGAERREQGRRANEVVRSIELERPFYISTREVTNAEFRAFAGSHSSGIFDRYSLDPDEHPVANVSWAQAARYCNWLSERESLPPVYVVGPGGMVSSEPISTGYRLPTEAEWVWVARYDGDEGGHKYPWGPKMPPPMDSGNFADTSAAQMLPLVIERYHDGYAVSSPVGSFRANRLGIYDLGGNVAEWMHDFYAIAPGSEETVVDPVGPVQGKYHVIRGSSWQTSAISGLRLAYRDYGDEPRGDLGFRVARYAK